MSRTTADLLLAPGYNRLQQRRRDDALQRQRAARSRQINVARLAGAASTPADAQTTDDHPSVHLEQPGTGDEPPAQMSTASPGGGDHSPDQQGMEVNINGQPGPQPRASTRALGGRGRPGGRVAHVHRGAQREQDARHFWSQQLQTPEWMTDVPPDLATHWLVMPRPAGPRCLITTARGLTTVRTRGGSVLLTCHTALPDGSPATRGSSRDFCMLEAVWHQPDSTLYVCDVLVWRSYSLGDCTTEFRRYWLQGKLQEDCNPALLAQPGIPAPAPVHVSAWRAAAAASGATASHPPPTAAPTTHDVSVSSMDTGPGPDTATEGAGVAGSPGPSESPSAGVGASGGRGRGGRGQDGHRGGRPADTPPPHAPWARLAVLPAYVADAAGLTAAYTAGHTHETGADMPVDGGAPGAQLGFQQDGLMFVHKESHYACGCATPLVLLWKDAGCSAWPVDTDPAGRPLPYQQLTLVYRMDATVATGDEPPVALGTMPLQWVQSMGPKLLRPGVLLRFTLREGGITWAPDGRPAGADLRYDGPANQRRGQPDAFSKVLFQHMARTRPWTLDHLLAAGACAMADDAAGGAPRDAPHAPSAMLPDGGVSMAVEPSAAPGMQLVV